MIYVALMPTALLVVGQVFLALALVMTMWAQTSDVLGRTGRLVGAVALVQIAVAAAGAISTHRYALADFGCLTGYLGIWWTMAIGGVGVLCWAVVATLRRREAVIEGAQWMLFLAFTATQFWVFLSHMRSALRCSV